MTKHPRITITVRAALLAKLKTRAKELGLNQTAYVHYCLLQDLNNTGAKNND